VYPDYSIVKPNQVKPLRCGSGQTSIHHQKQIKGQGENQVPFPVTEKELIQGCVDNDRRSQSELYKRYFTMMSGVAMRYCHSEDEVLQAVNYGFLKVLQNISKYRDEFALATWIRRIVVNHLIDEYRKSIKELKNVSIDELEVHEEVSTLNLAEYNYSEKELRAMLNELPDATRTVFNLYSIEGYKHTEIAERLQISAGTSKWHVSDARKRLAEMLSKSEKNESELKGLNI